MNYVTRGGVRLAFVEAGAGDRSMLLVPSSDGVKEPQNRRVQIVYDGGASS